MSDYSSQSRPHDIGMFGALINAIGSKSGDGNTGQAFPTDDVTDFNKGARFVPNEVTLLRREGKRVVFYNNCSNECCWYWLLPDGSKIYHYNPENFEDISENHDGVCPECGNNHIKGGKVPV